jgi:hypothetical protein
VQRDRVVRDEAVRLAGEIAAVARSGLVLPGTLTRRHTRCGRPGCRCGADPPRLHGPYWSWTRKADRKTVTRYLSDDQIADYQPFFDNARRLRELIGELEALNMSVVEADPRWNEPKRRSPQR